MLAAALSTSLMVGEWFLVGLQLKDSESWAVARALYKLP